MYYCDKFRELQIMSICSLKSNTTISFVVISFKKCEWVHSKTFNIKFDVEVG